MEEERKDPKEATVFLQYLTPPEVFQYNNGEDDTPMPATAFDAEVRKSAIDMEEWQRKRREEFNREHSGKHPFLEQLKSVSTPPGVHPLVAVHNELSKAKAEMRLVLNLLLSVNSSSIDSDNFKQVFRYVRHEESAEDKALTERTQKADLASSYLLFEEASSILKQNEEKFRRMVVFQRNYFNDVSLYGKYFNVITFHGDRLTFVKSTDSLLVNCSFMNNRDLSNCIPILPGEDGYVILKSHDVSFYSYLSITATLVDEFRSYESTYDFHPSIESSVFRELLTSFKRISSSPYLESNLTKITLLRHSILCKDLFHRLYDGCARLPKQSQIHIEYLDEAMRITIDQVFSVTIRLCVHSTVLRYPELLTSLRSQQPKGGLISQLLLSLAQQTAFRLVRHMITVYRRNHHSAGVFDQVPQKHVIETWAQEACNILVFQYSALFLRYFMFVCSFQFENLVYTNNELSESHLKVHTREKARFLEFEVMCDRLHISNHILLDSTGRIYVNDIAYDSLFNAFGGILSLIMTQVRLLFLNYCLQGKLGIEKDLGNDYAVINGNGAVTVVSFTYTIPTPLAFFHAFVVYCKQGTIINREAYWLVVGRKDRPSSLIC